MYRPAQPITQALKPRIDYTKTWQRITQLFKNPAPIRPDAPPAHLAGQLAEPKAKKPKLKGNVLHTMKEIVHIFLAEQARSVKAISVAIKTTRTSLAKRCGNLDPKTASRHIETLVEHGFLRAKVHIKAGLQLLINPALFIYDGSAASVPVAVPRVAQRPEMPLAAPSQVVAGIEQMRLKFIAEFAQKGRRPS